MAFISRKDKGPEGSYEGTGGFNRVFGKSGLKRAFGKFGVLLGLRSKSNMSIFESPDKLSIRLQNAIISKDMPQEFRDLEGEVHLISDSNSPIVTINIDDLNFSDILKSISGTNTRQRGEILERIAPNLIEQIKREVRSDKIYLVSRYGVFEVGDRLKLTIRIPINNGVSRIETMFYVDGNEIKILKLSSN